MSVATVSPIIAAVKPVREVSLTIAAADFAAFCAALRSVYPAWGHNVQIMRKATTAGPLARVVGLRGHAFSPADVARIEAIAAEYPAVPAAMPVSWPQRSKPVAIKLGRGAAWAGVR